MDASMIDTRDLTEETPSRPSDPFADVGDDELAHRHRSAQAIADGLAAAAVESEQLATDADAAFRSEPSAEAHTNAAVLAQLAHNAREAARANATELSTVSAEIARRAKLRRANELIPHADATALYERWRDRVVALVAQLHDTMAQEGERMIAELAARDAAAQELAPLAKELGMYLSDNPTRISVRDAGSELARRLSKVFGGDPHGPFRLAASTNEHNAPSVEIHAFKRFSKHTQTQQETSQQ
jgi:hypothetical protein